MYKAICAIIEEVKKLNMCYHREICGLSRAELVKQIAEEAELNERIKENLTKIIIPEKYDS